MAVDRKQLSEAIGRAPTDRQSEALDRARAVSSRRTQALMAAAGMAVETRWYVLILRTGFDNAVDNVLTNARFQHWMAVQKIPPKRRGGRKFQSFCATVVPALEGYMFVRVDNLPDVWHALKGIDGVVDVLGGSLNPKPLIEREIVNLQAFIENDPNAIALLRNALKEGDRVSVDSGPFAHFEGIVRALRNDRTKVDVDILGRTVPVDLDLAQVTKIG